MIRLILAQAGLPVFCLLLLWGLGWPAWLLIPLLLGWAAVLAWWQQRDHRRLLAGLRWAAAGDGTPPPMPANAGLAESLTRLHRSLEERAAVLGRMRRADEAIVENLPDPLLVLGAAGVALRANQAARRLFGAAGPGPLGGDLAALLRHPALAEAVDQALASGARQSTDVVMPVPVSRELAAQVIPMDPPLADGGRLVVVLADRTRERAVERMRADFVANASHELRTPLASLIGFIDTLRGPAEDDAEARRRFLAIMAEQAERMRRLIDELLSLSRIEVAEHQAPHGEADLVAVAQAEAAGLEPLLHSRGTTLELDVPQAARVAPADAGQLGQVVRNLLENALKHGKEGGHIRLAITPAGSRPGYLLRVSDDGPGIAARHIPRLTERFYRVDKARSRDGGGTGLGLAIVKHVINRHRGQLSIESTEGQGASFIVYLPG